MLGVGRGGARLLLIIARLVDFLLVVDFMVPLWDFMVPRLDCLISKVENPSSILPSLITCSLACSEKISIESDYNI